MGSKSTGARDTGGKPGPKAEDENPNNPANKDKPFYVDPALFDFLKSIRPSERIKRYQN